jgi:hypothetical protein
MTNSIRAGRTTKRHKYKKLASKGQRKREIVKCSSSVDICFILKCGRCILYDAEWKGE